MITGYICKKCNHPAPLGVGYATSEPADPNAHQVTTCPCGHSQSAAFAAIERALAG